MDGNPVGFTPLRGRAFEGGLRAALPALDANSTDRHAGRLETGRLKPPGQDRTHEAAGLGGTRPASVDSREVAQCSPTVNVVQAPPEISELVERFARGRHTYLAAGYNETQVRREFIDPFFTALGWDVANTAGYAEAYKDVVHEDRVKISGASKAPDYSFRIGGVRKFFVEAKKPSVNLHNDPLPAYQLRRYAWSAKLPLSVLTDFDEFVVYDCRKGPKPGEKASKNRLSYVRFDEYETRWAEIHDVFSKDAVLRGSFDDYAIATTGKRGTTEVDRAFLTEMETWREDLARNLVLRNDLTQAELNFAVQQTIDRIVFLRFCEDRGMEPYEDLRGALKGRNVYDELLVLFRRADDRYNSGLFHFKKEAGRGEPPDSLTTALRIDDGVLKRIIDRLYFPDSPYEFNVLPADILGQIYEQFLGKTIRKRSARRVDVEEKPAVRKAGGIVYTPTFVVDYIVEHSLGRILDSAEVDDVEGCREGMHPLRVLDPACGSGSFLIAVYQRLLDWHLDQYVKHPGKWSRSRSPRIRQAATEGWALTANERKRILLNHIYGVDIDPQAIEVTKLSLLLKVLEGESAETIGQQRTLFQERALPDLDSNIRCGNSLIGTDFSTYLPTQLWVNDEALRVNMFDWASEFPAIIADGGFDIVIGNPPYVLLEGEFRDDTQLAYFRDHYEVASYKLDLYHLFMEKALALTRPGGIDAMITPSNFLTNNFLVGLRRMLLSRSNIDHIAIVDRGVFEGRSVDNAIYITVAEPGGAEFEIRHIGPGPSGWTATEATRLDPGKIVTTDNALFTGSGNTDRDDLWSKIEATCQPLSAVATVNFGKQLRDRKKFTGDVVTVEALSKIGSGYRPCYTGRDVHRYRVEWTGLACLDTEEARRGGCWDRSKQDAPNKLLTRQIGVTPEFALDTAGHQCLNTMFMVNITDGAYSPLFLLGYLNSGLVADYWRDHFFDQRRTFPKIKGTYLKLLPVPVLTDSERDRAFHDDIARRAEHLMDLHSRLAGTTSTHDTRALTALLRGTERDLNNAVLAHFEIAP